MYMLMYTHVVRDKCMYCRHSNHTARFTQHGQIYNPFHIYTIQFY